VDGPELGLWRAPTDNDLGMHAFDGIRDAENWAEVGLDRLVSRTVEVTPGPGGLLVARRSGVPGSDLAVDVRYRWSGDDHGLALDVEVSPDGDWPGSWARIGIDLTLPDDFTEVAWAGLGPGPKYPDTGQAQRLGWFVAGVDDLQQVRPRPQEDGARAGVRELVLRDPGSNRALTVRGEPFSFTLRRWSQPVLAAARHPFDLVADGRLHLLLDHVQHGIGTASCGPGVLPAYRLTPRAARFSVRFS
jgi:beta-galactosidase